MDIPYLVQLLQNKITILNNAKGQAYSTGDLDRINAIDKELFETQNTIKQLNTLLAVTQAASDINIDLNSVVTAGVEAAQVAAKVPDDATACLSDYDISTYAADPLYIQKITDILEAMPTLTNATEITNYINKEVIGSFITGQMVVDAVSKFAVDTRLTMAIMELDSRFGTAGVGAVTFNPGNVGNTGSATRTYNSWADGVAAVAEWLSFHRVTATLPDLLTNPDTTNTNTATSTPMTNATTTQNNATTTATSTNPTSNTATSTNPFADQQSSIASTTTATSTPNNSQATTTPATTPNSNASTTPFFGPTDNSNGTTTATSTPNDTIGGTSTPAFIDPFNTSSTTPTNVASTTPPISPDASSTPPAPTNTITNPNGTTTAPFTPPDIGPIAPTTTPTPAPDVTPPPTVTPTSTSPDASTSAPQAYGWFGKKMKKGSA